MLLREEVRLCPLPAPPLWCRLELPTRPTPAEPTGLRWPAAVPSRIREPLLSGLATLCPWGWRW